MSKKNYLMLAVLFLVVAFLWFNNRAKNKDVEEQAQSSANTESTFQQAQNDGLASIEQALPKDDGFSGDRGISVEDQDNKILIAESLVNDDKMHAFNFFSSKADKNIYFFVIKASDGTYRAAANACEVCYSSRKGFSQIDDLIRCENCRRTYPKDKIALEKGGCNPGPIDKDVAIEDGQLIINVQDVEAVAYLF